MKTKFHIANLRKITIDGHRHNLTMVSDASPSTATPKMNGYFVHMAHMSYDRACAQDGYLKRPHPTIIDGDMRWAPTLRGHGDSQTVIFFSPKTPPRRFHRQKVLCDKPSQFVRITLHLINTPIRRSPLLIQYRRITWSKQDTSS